MDEKKSLEERVSELEDRIDLMSYNILYALQAHDKKFGLIIEQIDDMMGQNTSEE